MRIGVRRGWMALLAGATVSVTMLALTGTPAVAGAPPHQPDVDTPHEHADEDHVALTPAEEAQLQAKTRKATVSDVRAAAAAADASAADIGEWSAVQDWPVVGVHVALMPDGKVLAYDSVGDEPTEDYPIHNTTRAMVFDPATGGISRVDVDTGYNIFCSGLAHLADGRLFLAGGNKDSQLNGIVQTHVFDHADNDWELGPNMAAGRWYPTVTPLGNGDQLITSGRPTVPEVYRASDGTLRALSSASLDQPLYPWMDLAPDGRVVDTGPQPTMRKLTTGGTGTWQTYGQRDGIDRDYGSHAVSDIGKVLASGGGPSTNSASVINIAANPPTSSVTGAMAHGRRQHNLTVLADGSVLANGGLSSGASLVDLNAGVYAAERWNPSTGQWTTMAPEAVTRQYHATSLLLPDGRVLSSGGGICGTCKEVGYLAKNAQIFSPPYLFNADGTAADRPTVTTAPSAVDYGQSFDVATTDAADIRKVSLVRLGAVTHSNNMEQRYVPLAYTAGDGSLRLTAPANANIAPPGVYMLFVVDANGVPSVAKMITVKVAPPPDTPPTVQMTAPANNSSFSRFSTVTLRANATDDNGVTKVEFYRDTTRLGTDTTSPYSYAWTWPPPGTYNITARATDTKGQVTTSAAIRVTIRPLF